MNEDLEAHAKRAAEVLRDPTHAKPAQVFPDGQLEVDQAGLYAWRVGPEGGAVLSRAFDASLPELIYAGQAGATSSRAGVERSATLRSRITGNHLRGNIGSSTFRKTLTAALFDPLDLQLERPGKLDAESNAAVSEWMRSHLRIATFACPDRSTLAALEHAVLDDLDPPLNLMGMSATATRKQLKALRRQLS